MAGQDIPTDVAVKFVKKQHLYPIKNINKLNDRKEKAKMTTEREKQIEEAATIYQTCVFGSNPDGFHVAPYCNSETLADSFEQGARWADANPSKEVEFGIGDTLFKQRDKIARLEEHITFLNEKLEKCGCK